MSATEPGGRLRKLAQLFSSPADGWLLLRMTAWAFVLPALKHVIPLQRLARLMWRDGRGPVGEATDFERIVRLSWRAARIRPFPGRDNCLERSLIAYRYLSAASANPHLVVALRTSPSVDGHAWVTIRGLPVAQEDVSMFTPLLEFGARGEQLAEDTR